MLQKVLIALIAVYALCMAFHPFGQGEDAFVQPNPSPYAGNYEIPPGSLAKITHQGGVHYLDMDDGQPHRLIPTAGHRFMMDSESGSTVQFLVNGNGIAQGFIVSTAEGRWAAERITSHYDAITLFGKIRVE